MHSYEHLQEGKKFEQHTALQFAIHCTVVNKLQQQQQQSSLLHPLQRDKAREQREGTTRGK